MSDRNPPPTPAIAFPRMLGPLLGLKLLFLLCCVFIILRMDLPQMQNKAMPGRMLGYPILVAAIPVTWWW
ncbi:MAG: hypothetical protein ACR2J8_07470, partial [Thermomicrobiales bacterium]